MVRISATAYSVSLWLMPAVGSSSRMTLGAAGHRDADLERPLLGVGQQTGRHVAPARAGSAARSAGRSPR